MTRLWDLLSGRRAHALHATVIAYLALFLALGGTSYAATRVASSPRAHATGRAASDHSTGPRGPRGPRGLRGLKGARGPAGPAGPTGPTGPSGPAGPAGKSGASGSTVIASEPAWAQVGGTLTAEGSKYFGEYEEFDQAGGQDESGTKAVRHAELQTPLFSPSTLAGSAQHVTEIQICYAIADAPNASFEPDTLTLDHLYVYEYNQPTASVPSGKGAGLPGTVTWVPDGKSTSTLASVALSLGTSGCAKIPVSTPAINPDGYVVLDLEVAGTGNAAANLFLGRMSYTLAPVN
jgi:hypothetical protein